MADLRLSSMRIRAAVNSAAFAERSGLAVWQSGADQKAVLQRLVQVHSAAFALLNIGATN